MTEHEKIEHRLPDGDVLIVDATRRDPKVDAAFNAARDQLRKDARETYERLAAASS